MRLTIRACADVCGKKDVAKAVNVELVQVILGKVEFEAAFEVPDSSFKLISVECRD
jgi:hypothetical protein